MNYGKNLQDLRGQNHRKNVFTCETYDHLSRFSWIVFIISLFYFDDYYLRNEIFFMTMTLDYEILN